MNIQASQITNLKEIAHDVQRDNPHLGSRADVEHLLKCALRVIVERVATGHAVKLRQFGVFEASVFKGRTLKSPLMKDRGGSIDFKDQLVLRFRQSQAAKHLINEIASVSPKKRKAKGEGEGEGAEAPKKVKTKKTVAKKPAKKAGAKKAAKKANGEATPKTVDAPVETAPPMPPAEVAAASEAAE